MIRKTISALTALMMLLTAFVAAAETAPEPDYTTGTPWLYVDLIGNVTEETEANLKDNFALAANKEKLLKLEIPTGYPCIGIGEERPDPEGPGQDVYGGHRRHPGSEAGFRPVRPADGLGQPERGRRRSPEETDGRSGANRFPGRTESVFYGSRA